VRAVDAGGAGEGVQRGAGGEGSGLFGENKEDTV